MTAVRSVDSFKYGARLFAYLFVILLVGGGLLGLGAVIIENANTSLSNGITGIPDKTELAGGSVLALLGSFVLLSGLFGIVHKLVADGVDAGRQHGGQADSVSEADTSTDADNTAESATKTGPSPGEQAARDHGSGTTVPSAAASEPPESPQPPDQSDSPPEPPEPSPEPIAADDHSESPDPAPSPTQDSTSDAPAEQSPSEPSDSEPASEEGNSAAEDFSASENALDESFDGTDDEPVSAPDPVDPEPASEPDDPLSGERESTESVDESSPRADEPDSSVTADSSPDTDRGDQPRPEPSPEEIAFGSNPDDEESEAPDTDDDSDDDDDEPEGLASFEELEEESSSVEPAGDSSSGDPLADPNDE